ncbi:uncharacterized protein LOC122052482 isoform X1 [Zingiber officinale]|uniref:uncharacterized protein LOC122052482 isoform X1 n=1 Tax=Zingiber officinale TaxID=94328 RepID=UPI001C4AFEC8|nr:uncharacterized protein LOC122052482 isoform X1 [Zingiber officinale]
MPRSIESGAVEERRMFAVRNPNRTPVVAVSSPTYTYPDPLKYVKKVTTSVVESPPPEGRKCEERENWQPNFGVHGLFPSVSSFKQYQNAAMAEHWSYPIRRSDDRVTSNSCLHALPD